MALIDPSTLQENLAELQLCSSDPTAEALANTLLLDVAGVDGSAEIAAHITRLLQLALEQYAAKALAQELTGTFYCWFDEMSSTVRCSFSTSVTHEGLPFRCELRLLSHLNEVAKQVQEAEHHGEIPFEELQDEDWCDGEDEEEVFVLSLWMTVLPGDGSSGPLPR